MKLIDYIKDKGISGVDASIALDISPSYFSRLLTGERKPPGGLVIKIQKFTKGKVTLADFFDAA